MKATMDEVKDLKFIHLHNAFLCANCEMIANEMRDGGCSACGSTAVISLTRLLGGTVMPVPEEEILLGRFRSQSTGVGLEDSLASVCGN